MTEEPDNPIGDDVSDAVSAVVDTVGDLITGVPAPVRKNAIKAFGRLCTAAVEYPVALIENAIAERKAESQGRIKLIEVSAQQIAQQMHTDPEYARAAVKKFGQKILRERVNVDQVATVAMEELRSESPAPPDAGAPDVQLISADWLNAFENEAAQMSTEQMQRLFGKILAGEIRRPSSYSIKTIKIMAQLDNQAAALFKLVCSLSMSIYYPENHILDARVVSLGGNAAANALAGYGLPFDALNILQEYGLIIADYNSHMSYRSAIARDGKIEVPLVYQKARWGLVPKVDSSPRQHEFNVHGVGLSRCGKEMLSIVDIDSNDEYTIALKNFFDQQGLTMTPAVGPAP